MNDRFVRSTPSPVLPPPRPMSGPVAWARDNLFSSPLNTALTILSALVLLWLVPPFLDFALISAVWTGTTREACLAPDAGACWPYIGTRLGQIVYGFYDAAERWRVDIVFVLGTAGLLWLTLPRLPGKRWAGLAMLTVFPLAAWILLNGGALGLEEVPTSRWGGLLLTLVIAVTSIVCSLPIGILLALGRRSDLPVIAALCTIFIEFVRGVPLITILFMASNVLPLFLPDGATADKLGRALVAVTLFQAAYVAEVIRGGLQAIPRGQYEAAQAVGLGYWQMTGLVILPQALRLVIPGLVNTSIGVLKDTSLVSIIGFFDLLGVIQAGNTDPAWATPNTAYTGYLFAGAIFWVLCFGLSRYSLHMEERLNAGTRR